MTVGLLRRASETYPASWAIIRQWTGYDAVMAQEEAQVQRLERLAFDAIYTL